MTLEEKARELGRLIGQTTEYQAVKRSTDVLQGDREASAALREMEQLQRQAPRMMERGEQPTPEREQQLDDLLAKVQVSRVYQDFVVSQENFEKVMGKVNQWIMDGIRKGSASPIITLG